jgi:UDPglucose 6-dehydrogenase
MTMSITVLGTDYEGLAISVGLATLGHSVTAVDTNFSRARRLQRGMSVGDDLNLSKQMKMVLGEGLLKFTSEPEGCLAEADVVIIAGIPGSDPDMLPDRTAILRTAECLSGAIASFSTVMVTARIPTGSCRILQDWLNDAMYTGAVDVVAFPVFFSQPNGIHEFLHPDRIVLGYENEHPRRILDELFANLLLNEASIFHVSWEAAEMMRAADGVIAAGIPEGSENPVQQDNVYLEKVYGRVGQHR